MSSISFENETTDEDDGRGPVEYINIRSEGENDHGGDGDGGSSGDNDNDGLTTPLLSGRTCTGSMKMISPTRNNKKKSSTTALAAPVATGKVHDTSLFDSAVLTTSESTALNGSDDDDDDDDDGSNGIVAKISAVAAAAASTDNSNSSFDNDNCKRANYHDAVERALVLSKIEGSSQRSSSVTSSVGDKVISSSAKKLVSMATATTSTTKQTVDTMKSSYSSIPSTAVEEENDEDNDEEAKDENGHDEWNDRKKRSVTGVHSSPRQSTSKQKTSSGEIPKLSFAGGFLHLGASNELDDSVGRFLRQGSVVALVVWLALLYMAYSWAPAESFEVLEGAERNANLTVLFILLYTNVSRLLRMAVRDKSFVFVNSGVMTGSLTVQFIALVSILLMVFYPTPVIVDRVTGMRSHLVRWAEWVPLAFLMTFLAESVDLPISSNGEFVNRNSIQKPIMVAWINASALGVSTSAGALTAFCRRWEQWLAVVSISCALFSTLFLRLHQRYVRLRSMTPGTSVDEREAYDRAKYGLKTIAVCTVCWTCLTSSWIIIAVMTPRSDQDSIFSNESLILVTESFFEALSKIWYFDLLVDLHNVAFDDASRTMRRLEELRNFMSAVWDHSSDVLVWGSRVSTKPGSCINGIVSPSFFGKELGQYSTGNGKPGLSTLLVEINPRTGEYRCYTINLSEPITREKALAVRHSSSSKASHRIDHMSTDHVTKNISVILDLLCEAYASGSTDEKTTMNELYYPNPSGFTDGDIVDETDSLATDHQYVMHCEARISHLGPSSRLIVLRDISERFQRFEIEKKLVEEKTARRKDGEANRFTRHEVKNSILAAIGLVESIRDTKTLSGASVTSSSTTAVVTGGLAAENEVPEAETKPKDDSSQSTGPSNDESSSKNNVIISEEVKAKRPIMERRLSGLSDAGSGFEDSLGELDNTLRDILDSIMDHAMSLDVINEVYNLRRERVRVPELLTSIRRQANSVGQSRFSMKTSPQHFPVLGLDPRLLRHIYQNALSNACRYGRYDGNVVTSIEYDEESKVFRMKVFNEPGFGHEQFVALPQEEVDRRVFEKGSRLHGESTDEDDFVETNSSGDGAWIVKKCARILKGDVSLTFEPNRTVFSLWCPAKMVAKTNPDGSIDGARPFSLPPSTWGVVIDDSGIQRKLMDRFLKIAGIEKDRRVILGKNAEEIYGFNDAVVNILKSNPNDKVLIIVDENLEVVDGSAVHSTVSGSKSVEKILQSLNSEEESRLLALVRSANDSSAEISTYLSRAHGYLLKEPIDKDGVLGKIRPWWSKRFSTWQNSQESTGSDDQSTIDSEAYDPFYDIIGTLEVLDALCNVSSVKSLRNRWKSIKEKLQILKGDLKSTISSSSSSESLLFVVSQIDSLRLGDFPTDLAERWPLLKSQINAVVHANRKNATF